MNTFTAQRVLERLYAIPHQKFVIHGSTARHSVLIPKHPSHARYRDLCRKAVYATSATGIALIYAVVAGDPKWEYARKKKGFQLFIPKEGLGLCEGYIHVCRREPFSGNVVTWLSKRPVQPVEIIKVHPEMLNILWKAGEIDCVPFPPSD